MTSLVRDSNRIMDNLSNAEIDALSWSELKRKCQESGIPTVGVGRTKAALTTELKAYYYEKRRLNEKEAGWTSEESSSEDSSDGEDAYVGDDPKKMRIQNIKDQIEIRKRLKKLENQLERMNGKKYDIDDNFDRLFERTNEHATQMDELEERLNGIVSLLGINEVAGTRDREEDNHVDGRDQLINDDNENYNVEQNVNQGQPMGGKRTRGKLRVRSRRKSSIKKGKKSSSSKSSSKKSKKSNSSKSSKK
jgi:hypothetical protein